jgi:hypothetical protein
VEKDQTKHNGEPEQKRNDPVLIMAVHNNTRNPPSANHESGLFEVAAEVIGLTR